MTPMWTARVALLLIVIVELMAHGAVSEALNEAMFGLMSNAIDEAKAAVQQSTNVHKDSIVALLDAQNSLLRFRLIFWPSLLIATAVAWITAVRDVLFRS